MEEARIEEALEMFLSSWTGTGSLGEEDLERLQESVISPLRIVMAPVERDIPPFCCLSPLPPPAVSEEWLERYRDIYNKLSLLGGRPIFPSFIEKHYAYSRLVKMGSQFSVEFAAAIVESFSSPAMGRRMVRYLLNERVQWLRIDAMLPVLLRGFNVPAPTVISIAIRRHGDLVRAPMDREILRHWVELQSVGCASLHSLLEVLVEDHRVHHWAAGELYRIVADVMVRRRFLYQSFTSYVNGILSPVAPAAKAPARPPPPPSATGPRSLPSPESVMGRRPRKDKKEI